MKQIIISIVTTFIFILISGCQKSPGLIKEYTFEDGTADWRCLGATKIESSKTNPHSGNASIKISGKLDPSVWSFTLTNRFSLTPGKKYRLTGWMLVEKESTYPIFFKCALDKNDKWYENSLTQYYDLTKLGQWQELSTEFVSASDGNPKMLISVDKRPFDKSTDAIVYIDDITLSEVN